MVKNEWLALNRALFFPAISKAYTAAVAKPAFAHPGPIKPADLNHLDPAAPWHYPFALFSAGVAKPTGLRVPGADMVMSRSRADTIVLGDSGGFQISTGQIAFDPQKTAGIMLNWMEHMADYSMGFDFPTGIANNGKVDPHVAYLSSIGIDVSQLAKVSNLNPSYWGCLEMTRLNNDQFVKLRRPGATGILNVLQGRNHSESKHWYEQVKHYPFEGWAFAGPHQSKPSMVAARLLDMHNDGILKDCRWLHVLGTAKLEMGAVLTGIQRAVRDLGYPEFQISYDAASATKGAVKGQIVLGHAMSSHGWNLHMIPVARLLEQYADQRDRILWEVLDEVLVARMDRDERKRGLAYTHVSKSLTLGDLDPTNSGRMTEEELVMYHNTEAVVLAHEEVQDAFYESDPFIRGTRVLDRPQSVWRKIEEINLLFKDPVQGAKDAKRVGYELIDNWEKANAPAQRQDNDDEEVHVPSRAEQDQTLRDLFASMAAAKCA